MIHAKRLRHPCTTCEARVLTIRRAGAGLELVVDSEHSQHLHFPLLQLADATGAQALAVCLPKEYRPNSSEGSIRRYDDASGGDHDI